MSKRYEEVNKILIELTDVMGFTGQGKQMDAFLKARKELEDLIDKEKKNPMAEIDLFNEREERNG
uniref:Uncharacterized protein n=1 Tax=viral metagenome TaxID=1070528 RepID=A0A6M3Y239_9ZZZZ